MVKKLLKKQVAHMIWEYREREGHKGDSERDYYDAERFVSLYQDIFPVLWQDDHFEEFLEVWCAWRFSDVH